MEQLEMKAENPSDEFMRRYEELYHKRIHRIEEKVVNTELDDFEDTPTQIQLSNETVEYFIKNPEEAARADQRKKKMCDALQRAR